jgi:O-antigen ligase
MWSLTFTRAGLEHILVSAAVFLAHFPSWRHPAVFFTLSDLLFCLSLLTIVLTRGLPRAPLGPLMPYWLGACALLVVPLVGSSLINGVPMRALVVIAQYLFSFTLLPFVIMGRDHDATIHLVKIFVIGSVVANLAGVIFYYWGFDAGFVYVSGAGRLTGFVGDPNGTAHMLALTCPLVVYLWLSGRMALYYVVPVLLVLAIALVLTSSNNGLALTGLGLSAFLLTLRNLRYLGRALAGLAICLLLIFAWGSFWLPASFEQRVLGAVRSGSLDGAGTFEGRVALMKEAIELIDDTMLVGLGVDQYRVLSRFGAPVHNTFLLIWTEGGLPALIGWLGLLIMVIAGAVLLAGRRLDGAVGCAVGLVFACIGFTTSHTYGRHLVVPVHLAMALVLAAVAARARDRPAPAAQHPVPAPAAQHPGKLDGPAWRSKLDS